MYLLKLVLRPFRMAPTSQIFSVLSVGFLLVLSGFLFWLEQGLNPVVARLQSEQILTAYIDAGVESSGVNEIVDEIKTQIGAHADEVRSIKLMGPKEFLDKIQNHYPDLARELENISADSTAMIPRYVSISGTFDESAVPRLKSIAGIESVESSKDRYQQIIGAFIALRWMATLLGAGLLIAMLTGLFQLSRMNGHLHRETRSLLNLWGAGPLTIRIPQIGSSLIVGILGGLTAAFSWNTFGTLLARQVRLLSPLLSEMPIPSTLMIVLMVGGGTVLGLLSGILGSQQWSDQ